MLKMSAPTTLAVEPVRPASAIKAEPVSPLRRRVVMGIVLTTIAVTLGCGLWSLARRLAPQITAPVSSESAYVASFPEKSIAVLPFENLSEGNQDPISADAIQDDILTALAKIADLRVISRTSVSSYVPGRPRDLREIAQ